jgi:nucleoside-diphosphate-sugar epimerase
MNWNKQTLVITGSSGFVGEKLAIRAITEGFDVVGIDFKKSKNLDCKQLELDLASQNFYDKIPAESTIIHLASLSTDLMCRENPILAIDANLRATSLVLENAKKSNAKHFLFASSEWVYPERPEVTEQRESDRLDLADLNSLYAMTKLFGESLIRSASLIPYTILRFGIVYGPRKVPGSSAESIALKVYAGDEISVGSKETARRFIFIDDLIAGILQSASKGPDLLNTKILNLAGSELVSLDQIVSAANEILGRTSVIIDGGKIASIRNPLIDETTKILEWSPKINIRRGLESCLKVMSANNG